MLRRLITATLALCLATPALAQDEAQEFRRIRLNDGRELLGIVLESTAEGMRLRVPQGTVMVGYDKLSDMADIAQADWMAQAAARVVIAPATVLDEEVRALAADADGWLGRGVGIVPRTAVVDSEAWTRELGPRGAELGACGGELACLQDLATAVQADYLLIPTVKPGPPNRLSLLGAVVSSGVMLGTAQVALVPGTSLDGTDTHASGEDIARAVFSALDLTPDVDVKAAVASVFPAPQPAVAQVEPEPEPAPAAADPAPGAAPVVTAPSSPPGTPNRAVSIGLGFAPVPGLSSAYLRDGPGFLVSLLGTVGASWGTIYGVGTAARTAPSFWVPNILIPYAINVAFNQVSGAVSWKRLHADKAGARAARFVPIVMPSPDGGVVVSVAARF